MASSGARGCAAAALVWLLVGAPPATSAQTPPSASREEVVFLNEQQVLTPDYAVGNIAIGDPRVADFKVMPGRKELVVFGKGLGGTLLTLWDQKNVKRDEILITVITRQRRQLELDLKALLRDFPSVEVRDFAGSLAITGAVSAQDDLAAIEKIAEAAKVRSLVRFVQPTVVPQGGAAGPPTAAGATSATAAAAPGSRATAPAAMAAVAGGQIEYEVELLEASTRFQSGSYATGVEPSGRSLYKGVVKAPVGGEQDIFIGGNAVAPGKGSKGTQTVSTGLKLTLRPTLSDNRGRFKTAILVETNLPFAGETYDPAVWRKARWEITSGPGEPFGITGAELLAAPEAYGGSSRLGQASRAASMATTVPGVTSIPGTEYVPVFGTLFGSRSYKQKTTQLLMVLRPKAIAP